MIERSATHYCPSCGGYLRPIPDYRVVGKVSVAGLVLSFLVTLVLLMYPDILGGFMESMICILAIWVMSVIATYVAYKRIRMCPRCRLSVKQLDKR